MRGQIVKAMTQEEYSKMLAEARDQFKSGTPLFGKDGAFHRVLEDFLNAALEGEMDSHLQLRSLRRRIAGTARCPSRCRRSTVLLR